ncbi:26 kDa secreted antigen isoform X3 [Bemisia tabaci]|uniref:26 kDa secreted antigen isoform X3 n=1 Tax=Bemisia tabaci TaxID=7038 RepID=UPI003B289869
MHWLAKVENQYVTLIMITLQVILISGLIPNLPEDIERKCLRDGIKPDIVDVIPDFEIEVMFGDGVLVEFGNEINERECQEEPNVLWPFEKNTTHYTLIMTGFHRYTFIVFMQPEGEKIKFDEPKLNDSVHGRAHFNTKKFAAKYNLGDPVAINYFRAESFYG